MAAPTVPKSKEGANLNKMLSKEKSTKPAQKHVLCPETFQWPRPPKPVEESILNKLSETLKSLPNIFNSKKVTDTDLDKKEEKTRIRSQLQIGASSVFRALEHGGLECVIVSGDATPAITVDHIISLGLEKRCPLLCLDGLSATFARASESKVMPLTVGFKKLEEGQQSDFTALVALVKEHAPVKPGQASNPEVSSLPPSTGATLSPKLTIKPVNAGQRSRPIRMNPGASTEILAEIKRVFSSALVENQKSSKDKKKKKQKHKKNVKDLFEKHLHPQFEAGKRCIVSAVDRGLIQLVLASQEVESVLATSDLLNRQGQGSRSDKGPPVIILPGLTETLRGMTSGACCLTFLGIKKLSRLPPACRQDLKKLTEICLEKLKNASACEQETEIEESGIKETGGLEIVKVDDAGDKEKHVEKQKAEKEEEEEEEEEEDFSYLYVLKKDSKDLSEHRSELGSHLEQAKKATTFSTDFISLSGAAPSIQTGTDNVKYSKKDESSSTIRADSTMSKKSVSGISHPEITVDKGLEKTTPTNSKTSSSDSGFLSFSSPSENVPKTVETADEAITETSMDTDATDVPLTLGFSLDRGKGGKAQETKAVGADISTLEGKHQECATAKSVNNPTREEDITCTTSSFSVDRSGSGEKHKKTSPPSLLAGGATSNPTTGNSRSSSSVQQSEALGAGDLKVSAGKQGIDYLALDASARSKQKTNALKRKVDREEGFLSFAYTEANIKTMVCDSSKKRKKKKKNK